jgi:YD repeat-containing protein
LAADGTGPGRIASFAAAGNIDVESFTNQPNSTSNLGLTDSGSDWQQLTGTWGVSNGSAYLSTAAGNGNLAVTNGAPDGTFDVNMTSVQAGSGLVFRVADKNNFWRVVADTTTSTWKLIKRVDGADTVMASQSITCADNHYQLRLADANISFGCDQAGALQTSDPAFANQTQVGLYGESAGSTRWDHLRLSTASILTDKNATTYQFNATGAMSRTLDATGHATTFNYDTHGHLTHVTSDVSGRSLTFDWTGDHVSSVSTDPIDASHGPLTWNYSYTGSLLTSVTAPGQSASTSYAYTTTAPADRLDLITLPSGNINARMGYNSDGSLAWTEDGLGHRTSYSKTTNQTGTTSSVTDPNNHTTTWVYDSLGRLTRHTDAEQHSRTFGYNDLGYLTTVVDENNDTLALTTDERGNTLTRTTARQDGQNNTSYYRYFLGAPGDPRNDKLTVERDPRSASATDDTYATTYSYDVNGHLLAKSSPATPDQPTGTTISYSYSTGTEPATDTGTIPAGLVLTSTDARGKITRYHYTHTGDLTQSVTPSGLTSDYAHDGIGRLTSETETSDSYPSGLITSYTYDAASRIASITQPPVTNPITGITHTQQTSYSYDADENPTLITLGDTTGGDTARTTHLYYDGDDRLDKQVDPAGETTLTSYDPAGNVATRTDANGTVTAYSYSPRNELWQTTIKNFIDDPVNPGTPRDVVIDSRGYDPGGRLATETDALGHTTVSSYYADDLLKSSTLAGYREPTPATGQLGPTTRDITVSAYQYDAAGNPISVTRNGVTTTTAFDPSGRVTSSVLDPSGLARTTTLHYDPAGNLTQQALTAAGTSDSRTTTVSYTDAGLPATTSTVNDATPDLVTSYGYDQRGLQVATTDPRGYRAGQSPDPAFTTTTSYDPAGRPSIVQQPPVASETGGGTPTVTRPTTKTGYDTFGDITQTSDADGNITSYSYDALGRVTGISYPSYTPKGSSTAITPTESFTYDGNGNNLTYTDRRGQTTTATYDMRNRLVALTRTGRVQRRSPSGHPLQLRR